MKSIFFKAAGFVAVITFLFACETMNDDELTGSGTVVLEFDNRIGSNELNLGQTVASNNSGEEYTVTTLNYFVSNIQLTAMDGKTISFPDQYYIVREADEASQRITLNDVPAGDYHHLTYMIGVDSLKSVSPEAERTGVLDIYSYGDDNMYWVWNSGYIFFKMEGVSPVSTKPGNVFKFHIGGFGGKDTATPNNLKVIDTMLSEDLAVRNMSSSTAHVVLDVTKVFDGINSLKIAETPVIMDMTGGMKVSANYSSAFSMDHIH
ncbi:MbnP family protein [Jiulongibacter sediminis]|uniref:Copper-binding protein MbnP-like domain-containing protein n=1 Tax=Jiulongibacter sediminis TaxID=1605367 RepID=A0A0P7B9Z4_9BACT|nr:MbnP family protein [Jiulongibacter sediminis]KPM47159.1 hypothetical protein AFM12_15185 [Jiulongibacter sediminis]TBX22718.1 hypothetical protein TK44_15195 [Jiulongibacter sediminis]